MRAEGAASPFLAEARAAREGAFADGGYSFCFPMGRAFPAFPGSAEIRGCQTLLRSMLRVELPVFKSHFCVFLCNPKPFSRNE